MKAPFDLSADLDTPVSAYLKLKPLNPRYLLESVVGGERVGRWSFLGFGEAFEVRLQDDVLTVDGESQPAPQDAAGLLDALRGALARAPRPGPDADLPFSGGLVGVAGWEIVRRLERVQSTARAVGEPELAYVATRSMLVFDHATRRAAVLHDGSEAERLALRARVIDALRGPLPAPESAAKPFMTEPVASMDKDAFIDAVERVKAYIAAGEVYQLVLSMSFEGETNVAPFEVYRALRLLNPSPYMTYVDLGDRVIVGSSPEALVTLSGRQATLRPIAGTRPRGRDEEDDRQHEQDLLADPKEASEHVMLVDLARNDLGRVAMAGTVEVAPYRVIERYSHVMHIVSGVTGTLAPDYDCFDLFAATFPAGTVVGAPKVRAMNVIDELEPVQRGLYAGTVGYFGHGGTMDQAIAIRTLVFSEGRYRVQAGAGLVADSVPAAEHAECEHKSMALRAALKLAVEGLP